MLRKFVLFLLLPCFFIGNVSSNSKVKIKKPSFFKRFFISSSRKKVKVTKKKPSNLISFFRCCEHIFCFSVVGGVLYFVGSNFYKDYPAYYVKYDNFRRTNILMHTYVKRELFISNKNLFDGLYRNASIAADNIFYSHYYNRYYKKSYNPSGFEQFSSSVSFSPVFATSPRDINKYHGKLILIDMNIRFNDYLFKVYRHKASYGGVFYPFNKLMCYYYFKNAYNYTLFKNNELSKNFSLNNLAILNS